ncbi:(E)-4-hydroxy-3-methylbut-2-enyl-diphosphate synthase [Leptospira santarosai]|uniref:4-hydroxy-3-methylbut-2-en-1-yl diphosphate synthase (flavodoxin) n=2 Tax=Leptospira santarosai TaxID=28183 RepID=M6UYH3_9LEPT|nr:(E)-4-hydroxy-3-methylbut-2-enyl-diphosphate synthase [Leptospira santarosai]EMO58433.1 putative 4-hydroxy-3-methylbut-2-en-1-yl diphosphate synthase [Leptospira santarosai str. CBC1416]EMO46029.1 putative 4-hydroxy-3-methylbut-2-en-1-yl diphosphate synthase [Leptospira santarosai str. ZUN179]MDI7184265.1 (E)-4-hydroxy-3-methylbut-2-enyl-diphosphate synthase [Leptospira santarosai]MDI7187731.1 (E)-4-hydroxy-3-methylbut-2-enyl-diphosphate synthase [Leptospira santarosai]MDI7191453.1 (E)-4-hy
MNFRYNHTPFGYKRRQTREVKVGDVKIGGNNPIVIQSMINSDTTDTEGSVKQILELERAGCEIVRLTVPSQADADNLPSIRQKLKKEGSKVPLVADIHFTPSVAMKAVEYVEKVRINPGNFADKKKFAVRDYTDSQYDEELERISETFSPLVLRCKELGVSLRIGTNHGSLSDRIMNRYGDTPQGMVESALEFVRIAESLSYYDIIVSMKASNPQVMVQAYRMLASRFDELKMNYPLHLGVTEAGDGKDGRIKSAVGIGSLLEDGLGDTIRVSLTEDPVSEIPVAKLLADKFNGRVANPESAKGYSEFRNPFTYQRFYSSEIKIGSFEAGENHPVRVETVLPFENSDSFLANVARLFRFGKSLSIEPESILVDSPSPDRLKEISEVATTLSIPVGILLEKNVSLNEKLQNELRRFPKVAFDPFLQFQDGEKMLSFLKERQNAGLYTEIHTNGTRMESLKGLPETLSEIGIKNVLFSIESKEILYDYRKLGNILSLYEFPILLHGSFQSSEEALYDSAIGIGGLLIDGIGDIIRIKTPKMKDIEEIFQLSYDLLQGTRLRLTKTEYISCPSCGRTLFNLQETTARIKSRTGHLKGVKIAVMGCIVNGPGEMADADFGYVGAGPGKVHLYRGKEIVMKNVPSEVADEKLVELIKEQGLWQDITNV